MNTQMKFSIVEKGSYSQITVRDSITAYSKDDFEKLWDMHSLNRQAPPKVDFRRHMVVGIFLGQKRTGGYSIAIDRVEDTGYDLLIHTKVSTPQGMVTQAQTQPFIFVKVPKLKERTVRVGGLS